MPDLVIETVSSTALRKLQQLADCQARAKEEVAREILENALADEATARGELARRIRRMTPSGVTQTDSTEIIRQLRDE